MRPVLTRRLVSNADEPFLFDLFRAIRARRFEFQPGGHPQMAVMVRQQFRAFEAALDAASPDAEHSLLLLDEAPVGRLRVVSNETGFRLVDLSILPDRQRKGLGTVVVEDLMGEARAAGRPLHCVVAQDNMAAYLFCRQLGFQVEHQDAGYVHMRWVSRQTADVLP